MAPAPIVKPSTKVVKLHIKVKADKPLVPKVITASHTKELIHNAMKTHRMSEMIGKGIPSAVAVQALGEVYEPIEGIVAVDPSIWGPVV